MNSKIVRSFMVMAIAMPIVAVAQGGTTNTASAATPPAGTAPAPTATGPTRIGVISIQDAILATNEGQKEFETLGKKFEPKRNEIKSMTDEIDGLKKQLDASKAPNDENRAGLVRQIEAKQKSLTRSQEDAQNDFVGQQNEIAQKILQKMGPVIDKYAKDNGLGLIIDISKPWPDGPVLWAGQSVDITKTVVDIYNQQSGVPSAPSASRPGAGGTRPGGVGATRPATTPTTKPQGTTPPKQ
jgi:outer membrane protein